MKDNTTCLKMELIEGEYRYTTKHKHLSTKNIQVYIRYRQDRANAPSIFVFYMGGGGGMLLIPIRLHNLNKLLSAYKER